MEHYDVIIIGAGLAGLQCARLLGREGLRVLLVDRKDSLNTSIHTTGIFVRRTLEDFDIPDDCLGPAVRHVTLYSPSRRRMELASPLDEFRVGKMGKLYTRYLDHCFLAGVAWLPGTRYAGHRDANGKLIVRLDSNRGPNSCRYVAARYLVGADGANSRVACNLQLDRNRECIVGVDDVLTAYSGEQFRSRFVSRLWMRRLVANIRQPMLLELSCAALRLPILNSVAWNVFFGRGSFPDVKAPLLGSPLPIPIE